VPLTITQQSDIRRHLQLAVGGLWRTSIVGGSLAIGAAGFRWNQAFGLNEFKMNNLMPDEECRLTGNVYGGIAFMGPLTNSGVPVPATGDTVSVAFTGAFAGSPHIVTATAQALDSLLNLSARLAQAITVDATMSAAGFVGYAPFGTGPYSQNYVSGNPLGNASLPVPQIAIQAPVPFTMVVSNSGLENLVVTNQGVQLPPMAPVDWTVKPAGTVYGFLPILNLLEGAWMGSSQNLDTTQAGKGGEWIRALDEQGDRYKLYVNTAMQMKKYLYGIAGDGGLVGGGYVGGGGPGGSTPYATL
jgi:hypothetical protein